MDEKRVSSSYWVASEGEIDDFYPIYFGVSCAFFALRVFSSPEKEDERWSDLCNKMLQGSAQLLGLLVWRIQRERSNGVQFGLLHKLETAEKEVERLKKLRHDGAKANEKVVGIFATQEQCWLIERKKLRQHITALTQGLRLLEKNKEEALSEMNDKLREMELEVQSKEKLLEEEQNKRKELEEKLSKAENIADELRETAKHEAQEHATDLMKQKTAFIELVSNQRHLEAELGRAFKQLEAKKQELNSLSEQKEESVMLAQKLSMEVLKMRTDLDQKEKIMSAMLRKSKLDTAEKEMLVKEVKLSKAKRKQAELESERWRAVSECSRHERTSLRNMFAHQSNVKLEDPSITRGASQIGKGRNQIVDYVLDCDSCEYLKDPDSFSVSSGFSTEGRDELALTTDVNQLEGWVQLEAEKYATVIEKRHHLEIDAFAEQMRLKDERLEACRWRLLSLEIESKRLQSYVERLNQDMSELRHENMKLEALLLAREEEFETLKEQFTVKLKHDIIQSIHLNPSLNDPELAQDVFWSKLKIVKRNPMDSDQEKKANPTQSFEENDNPKGEDVPSCYGPENIGLIAQNPKKELGKEKDFDLVPVQVENKSALKPVVGKKLPSLGQQMIKTTNSEWKTDVHALGVSYKIKRLKQQVIMLERLSGKKQENEENMESNDDAQDGIKSFLRSISLLDKQVGRYQTLQDKTDELCKRMHDSNVDTSHGRGDCGTSRTKGETKTLEHFLEEIFQLQRYMVATGQKLVEVQSKIASGFVGFSEELDSSVSFDINRFADNIRTLFQEVQKGLEVRISRIIGDIQSKMACDGMIRIRR